MEGEFGNQQRVAVAQRDAEGRDLVGTGGDLSRVASVAAPATLRSLRIAQRGETLRVVLEGHDAGAKKEPPTN